VLRLAATADEATLHQLARAIRRYSTTRAQQSWEEATLALRRFTAEPGGSSERIALCLKWVRIEVGQGALERHQANGCVSLALDGARVAFENTASDRQELQIADSIRRLIEELRALRVAFGLPHFQLDSYVRSGQVTFTWRPLS
jgi:cation transport ATPase